MYLNDWFWCSWWDFEKVAKSAKKGNLSRKSANYYFLVFQKTRMHFDVGKLFHFIKIVKSGYEKKVNSTTSGIEIKAYVNIDVL